MTSPRLTAERIGELALKLAMVASRPELGPWDVQYQQIERALIWHRQSCGPLQVALRSLEAVTTKRLSKCLDLISQQKAMLALAAQEGLDDTPVLDALIALYDALVRYDLGPDATPKQRLALEICKIPEVRKRYALLVRAGEITGDADGLKLPRAKRRRIACLTYAAMLAGWPAFIFTWMMLHGTLTPAELAVHLVACVAMSAYLTRGLFAEIRSDEHTVRDLNAHLRPRANDQGRFGK